jgi:RNase P/RNase MRP subunit POP5
MKALIPSQKENKRYLFVKGKDLKENIEKAILEFSGTLGLSKCGLSFISSDSSKNQAVISVNRESLDLVRASLVVFPEKMEVTKVSGTLKGLSKK